MDHVILAHINLILYFNHFLNEINELLHLLSEELIDVIFELFAKDLYPVLVSILRVVTSG